MNKTESYCYQKYKSSSNNSCVIKEKNIVGKNLLEGTYFDGNGIPKMIGITKAEYLEYKQLQQENKQLKIKISAKEEVCNRLESNWNKLKEYVNENLYFYSGLQREDLETDFSIQMILYKMQEIEGKQK